MVLVNNTGYDIRPLEDEIRNYLATGIGDDLLIETFKFTDCSTQEIERWAIDWAN